MTEKVAATLTINRAGEMTASGRAAIARWLRRQARAVLNRGDEYSVRYTAKYLYQDKDDEALEAGAKAAEPQHAARPA